MLILVLFLVVEFLGNSLGDAPQSGPFNMKVFNLTDCGERTAGQMIFDFQLESINDTTGVLEGLMQVPMGVGDDMRVNIEVLRWKESSFSEKAYFLKFNKLCSGIREIIKETFTQVTQYLHIEDTCPIIAGSYNFKNFLFSPKTNLVKEAIYGLYKSRLEARKGDTVTGCLDIVFAAIPKEF